MANVLAHKNFCTMRISFYHLSRKEKSLSRNVNLTSLPSLLKHQRRLSTGLHQGSSGRAPQIPGSETSRRMQLFNGWQVGGTEDPFCCGFRVRICYQIRFESTVYLSDRPCFNGQPSALEHNLSRVPGVWIGELTGPVMLRRARRCPENY